MALCSDCSKSDGVVKVGPLMICPACAEARIRSLEAVAEERAREWQRERIRAEKLAEKAADDARPMEPRIRRLTVAAEYARALYEALEGKQQLEEILPGLTWQVDWLGIAIEECYTAGDLGASPGYTNASPRYDATPDPQYDPEDALYDHYEARSDAP